MTRWHLVPAAAALSLLILACTDRSENPVAPLSSPSATPVFGQSTVDNGTGACLTEDTENAGYINNVGDLNCT
ncbi:MAG TPA: hypothetical protein VFD22_11490, partial [Gemmatimonadaceae bacterium]|nr:hypothetical protein [Gemmatimonadaceae bacterium]